MISWAMKFVRKNILIHKDKDYVKYFFSGLFNTALTFAIYSSIIFAKFSYLTANSVAWIVGIAVSFTINSKFVFKKTYSKKRLISFVFVNIFSFFVSTTLLFIMVGINGVNPIMASIIAIPIIMIINFCLLKFAIFK